MKAEFYIIKESFLSNITIDKKDLVSKIEALHADFLEIRKHDTDSLFIHPGVYDLEFMPGISLTDLLYTATGGTHLDKETMSALKRVMVESEASEYNGDDIITVLLPEINGDNCIGIMTFNQLPDIERDYQIVYTDDSWLKLRRKFLGKFPTNPIHFIETCSVLFPSIYFHEQNKETVGVILSTCSKKIVAHLSALNDNFKNYKNKPYNRNDTLNRFSVGEKLDETASVEGNASRKRRLIFNFVDNNNQIEQVCCEPHLKLPYNDNYPGDKSYSTDRRIYFHEGKENIHNGKILIGHIGDHL